MHLHTSYVNIYCQVYAHVYVAIDYLYWPLSHVSRMYHHTTTNPRQFKCFYLNVVDFL